jgi:hypothetical protein
LGFFQTAGYSGAVFAFFDWMKAAIFRFARNVHLLAQMSGYKRTFIAVQQCPKT